MKWRARGLGSRQTTIGRHNLLTPQTFPARTKGGGRRHFFSDCTPRGAKARWAASANQRLSFRARRQRAPRVESALLAAGDHPACGGNVWSSLDFPGTSMAEGDLLFPPARSRSASFPSASISPPLSDAFRRALPLPCGCSRLRCPRGELLPSRSLPPLHFDQLHGSQQRHHCEQSPRCGKELRPVHSDLVSSILWFCAKRPAVPFPNPAGAPQAREHGL